MTITDPIDIDDHALARHLADLAGRALVELRRDPAITNPWLLRDEGDRRAHDLLVAELARFRPDDIVLSEEAVDDRRRLEADRTWIIDPLDGTQDYPYGDSIEWAVHVALVEEQLPTAAAVAVPGLDLVAGTDNTTAPDAGSRTRPIVVSGRSNAYHAAAVADALDARLTACGSAGVKAMLVVTGEVDVYVHASGLYEWDVCAPAAVAAAAGLVVTDLAGRPILYNKPQPVVRGLVIARPEYAATVEAVLGA